MYKREIVWLIVRLLGLYCAYCALVTLFGLAGVVSSYSSSGAAPNGNTNVTVPVTGFPGVSQGANPTVKPTDPAADAAQTQAVKDLLKHLFLLALYGAAGFYLLKKGDFLFHLLNSENLPQRSKKDPTVTTLKL